MHGPCRLPRQMMKRIEITRIFWFESPSIFANESPCVCFGVAAAPVQWRAFSGRNTCKCAHLPMVDQAIPAPAETNSIIAWCMRAQYAEESLWQILPLPARGTCQNHLRIPAPRLNRKWQSRSFVASRFRERTGATRPAEEACGGSVLMAGSSILCRIPPSIETNATLGHIVYMVAIHLPLGAKWDQGQTRSPLPVGLLFLAASKEKNPAIPWPRTHSEAGSARRSTAWPLGRFQSLVEPGRKGDVAAGSSCGSIEGPCGPSSSRPSSR